MKTRIHWLDQPGSITLLKRGSMVVLGLTVVAEFMVQLHPRFEVEGWLGFHAAYGFIACVLMIVLAKVLGMLLKRTDTFYAKDDVDG